jgi:Phosphoesterase family
VIVVVWDDWGGWYDNASPPTLSWYDGSSGSTYYRGYGIRTPMLILSPYAKQGQDNGHVSLRQFEPGSILKFIEEVFDLPSLGSLGCSHPSYYYVCNPGYTDSDANTIGYVLDTTQSPRAYIPITTKYPPSKFEHGGSYYYYYSNTPPDGE